ARPTAGLGRAILRPAPLPDDGPAGRPPAVAGGLFRSRPYPERRPPAGHAPCPPPLPFAPPLTSAVFRPPIHSRIARRIPNITTDAIFASRFSSGSHSIFPVFSFKRAKTW